MYKIGDKILYPMHGAGIIEDIEEQTVLGGKKLYYILRMPSDGMKVMLPTDSSDEIGVRFVISREEGMKVLESFRKEPVTDGENWNKRHRDNMVRIKSGDIYQVAAVVKSLMYREREKGLSTSERKLLTVSKQILTSELVLCGAAGKDDIESIMTDCIEEMF